MLGRPVGGGRLRGRPQVVGDAVDGDGGGVEALLAEGAALRVHLELVTPRCGGQYDIRVEGMHFLGFFVTQVGMDNERMFPLGNMGLRFK